MKKILISQRVDLYPDRNEKRDALDQNLFKFLFQANLLPIALPNDLNIVKKYIDELNFDGILLTGGNDLVKYGGNVPERDEVEYFLINYAIQHNKPLLGICRGMQIILDFFNIPLLNVKNHVKVFHNLNINNQTIKVNSYHNYGIFEISEDFNVLAQTTDNVIEAIKHRKYPIYGIMWHPERDIPFNDFNIKFVRKIFDR